MCIPRTSLRHRLRLAWMSLVVLSLPTALQAEVCDKVRPNWKPGETVGQWGETILLFSTVPSLALLIATAAALRFRSQWGGLAIVVGWSAWVSVLVFFADDTIRQSAMAEGCMSSPSLFIGTVAAICIATILYTLPRETRL